MNIEEALQKAEGWLEIEGVEGIAHGKVGEDDCITVFLSTSEPAEKIPKTFHGYQVCIEFTGTFHAQF